MIVDELIAEYAEKLERIYNERTAGDHTFTGVLAMFLSEVDNTRVLRNAPEHRA